MCSTYVLSLYNDGEPIHINSCLVRGNPSTLTRKSSQKLHINSWYVEEAMVAADEF